MTPREKADQFLTEATQFRLGALLTETSHPRSRELSYTARDNVAAALRILFDVDRDVLERYRTFAASPLPGQMASDIVKSLRGGGKLFCTGCGATGRLSIQMVSIWREFWQRRSEAGQLDPSPAEWENRAFSVMAGGDFALIKSVEGFEDFTQFGRKQIRDLGVSEGDIVFAITEGGETSFVIGTAWEGLDSGAKVYFVYNNPDDVLRDNVIRSREVIDEPRITRVNLTTGPMAITGSTRMQATSIQLCVMITVFEMALRQLTGWGKPEEVPSQFLQQLEAICSELVSERLTGELARLIEMEESVYRKGLRNNYYADALSIDVLTDTTERSPTFCIPAFRKKDDDSAAESWSFLFLPYETSEQAWERLLRRQPKAVEWTLDDVHELIGADLAPRQHEIIKTISLQEIMRFRIGMDGLNARPHQSGGSATAIVTDSDAAHLSSPSGFYRTQLNEASAAGAATGVLAVGTPALIEEVKSEVSGLNAPPLLVTLPCPTSDSLLAFGSRIGVKMLLNAVSTCTMVRLGRVLGNVMIWVVPSNLKLIDRSTRYISHLAGVPYEKACHTLFEVIEFVTPRWQAGQAYPAPVGVSVMMLRHGLGCEQAEERLLQETG